jgi:hypothetical protein
LILVLRHHAVITLVLPKAGVRVSGATFVLPPFLHCKYIIIFTVKTAKQNRNPLPGIYKVRFAVLRSLNPQNSKTSS